MATARSETIRRLLVLALALVTLFLVLRANFGIGRAPLRPVGAPYELKDALENAVTEGYAIVSESPEHIDGMPRSRLNAAMQRWLDWTPPGDVGGHYPPYSIYSSRDYDPNRWEGFASNDELFLNATTDHIPDVDWPKLYNPYPTYNTEQWLATWRGEYVPCEAPNGLGYNENSAFWVKAHEGVPSGIPQPAIGSYEAISLDDDVCFVRSSRLGPYGLIPEVESPADFRNVKWGKLQNECLRRNGARYKISAAPSLNSVSNIRAYPRSNDDGRERAPTKERRADAKHYPRTAVLIRTYSDYAYSLNDYQNIRSLINELALLSGGEYHVFLFVHIKDLDSAIFTDSSSYQDALDKHVPKEFHDIVIMFTEAIGHQWYPKVGEWSVYHQQFMPVQWFSKTHPEFDFVWNWEMDARYIGNHYHFLEQVGDFSRRQPRKYLWERNARFYIPGAHGDWKQFFDNSNSVIAKSDLKTVWGPQHLSRSAAMGPTPPTTEAFDDFAWGIGEEADFISLLPIWDPTQTEWAQRNNIWGWPRSPSATEDQPYPDVPRRAYINTVTRLSSKLLQAMHVENEAGYSMASEMWPTSVALNHGFKAVYAPHPIYTAHKWPPDYMDAVLNADGWGAGSRLGGTTDKGHGVAYDLHKGLHGQAQTGSGPNGEGQTGRWSQQKDAVYSPDREHNLADLSWAFWSDFGRTIYWRWLGWTTSFEPHIVKEDAVGKLRWTDYEDEHGRMCLPGMLLHPVKNVRPP